MQKNILPPERQIKLFSPRSIPTPYLERLESIAGVQGIAFGAIESCFALPAIIANASPFTNERPLVKEGWLDTQRVPTPEIAGGIDLLKA